MSSHSTLAIATTDISGVIHLFWLSMGLAPALPDKSLQLTPTMWRLL